MWASSLVLFKTEFFFSSNLPFVCLTRGSYHVEVTVEAWPHLWNSFPFIWELENSDDIKVTTVNRFFFLPSAPTFFLFLFTTTWTNIKKFQWNSLIVGASFQLVHTDWDSHVCVCVSQQWWHHSLLHARPAYSPNMTDFSSFLITQVFLLKI